MKLLILFAADLVYSACETPDGGHGQDVHCPNQMYMRGWCTSGGNKDCCGSNCSHRLLCCDDYTIPRDNCYSKAGHEGEFLSCDGRSAVTGACGSGKNGDCTARFLSQMYNETGVAADEEVIRGGSYTIAWCCEHNLNVAPYGYWFMEGCGYDVECRPNQIMSGICGSGKNADCQNVPNGRKEATSQRSKPELRCSQGDRYTGIYCVDVLP